MTTTSASSPARSTLVRTNPVLRRNGELLLLLATAAGLYFTAIPVQLFRLHVAGFLVPHLALRLFRKSGSQLMLPVLYALTGAGLYLQSFFHDRRQTSLAQPYLEGVLAGCAVFLILALFPRLYRLAELKYVSIVTALGLAAALVIFGSGPAGTDARINLLGVQPAEAIKLLVVVFLAAYFSGRDIELRCLHAFEWGILRIPRLRDMRPVLLMVSAVLALFFLQKDLGPALVLYLLFLGLFIATSRRYTLGTMGLAVLLGAFGTSYRWGALATVKTRLEMWLSPWDNHHTNGIQLAESLWAMSAGGLRGLWSSASIRHIPAGHTDLILAAGGEMFGLGGLLLLLILVCLLFRVFLRAAFRAPQGFEAYFAYGLAMLYGVQSVFMAAATLGMAPLTGLPVPFLSYGKSAMIAAFALAGMVWNISSRPAADPAGSKSPLNRAAWIMPRIVTAAFMLSGLRTVQVMSVNADALMARGALTPQADGVRRFVYNRRLTEFAARIRRGEIVDRNGIALATSDPQRAHAAAESLGLPEPDAPAGRSRYYPLGSRAVHLIGHTGAFWTDPRTIERLADAVLRGYRNPARLTAVDGKPGVMYDYSELVPIYRDWQAGGHRFALLVAKDRSFHSTLDARLQVAAEQALETGLRAGDKRATNAAAIVLDASTGRILASASLPSYNPNNVSEAEAAGNDQAKSGLDRTRFEIYPPGSSFKIVTAAALLEAYPDPPSVHCNHRNIVTWTDGPLEHKRSVVDDERDAPHRDIDWQRAIVESCNVYYATMGADIGASKLYEVATQQFHLDFAHVHSADEMQHDLADNSYGQGQVTVSPQSMALVAAAVANGGFYVEPSFDASATPAPKPTIPPDIAAKLRQAMIGVVKSGTGQGVAPPGLVVGGKTGTAQTMAGDRVSDSWFIGFAEPPEGNPEEPIAFAFFVEHGGYGARAAVPAAKAFLMAYAKMNGVIQGTAGASQRVSRKTKLHKRAR